MRTGILFCFILFYYVFLNLSFDVLLTLTLWMNKFSNQIKSSVILRQENQIDIYLHEFSVKKYSLEMLLLLHR